MADRIFRGAREVVLVDGESTFRPLPRRDRREVFAQGEVLGEDDACLGAREAYADATGRFLVAVHDPERRTLALHADRHAFLPAYWCVAGDRLLVSTRVRPLVERGAVEGDVDPAGLSEALALQLPLGERTLVAGVSRLAPGTSLTVNLDTLDVVRSRSWDPAALLRPPRRRFEEVADDLVERFLHATRRCTENAPHVAVTLSGGMDTRCLLAAVRRLGRPATAYHVGIPGSRAERYTRQIAETCGVPLRLFPLDADFASRYHAILRGVVQTTEGMKLVPQPEMLWLRDQIEMPAVALHGAFGELSKLRVLRDFRLDEALERGGRAALADLLWRRIGGRFRSHLRIFAPDYRTLLEGPARASLHRKLDAFDADLGVPEMLQLCYFDEFVKSASYGHLVWNERVPTRFPFIAPDYVDLLLRVRTEDRLQQRFQLHFLQRVDPALHALPDENVGAHAASPRLLVDVVRFVDRVRTALFASPVASHHGDLLAWMDRTEPSPEVFLAECRDDPFYDSEHLAEMVTVVHETSSRTGPLRARSLRRARRDAQALQTFFMVELWRRFLAEARERRREQPAARRDRVPDLRSAR